MRLVDHKILERSIRVERIHAGGITPDMAKRMEEMAVSDRLFLQLAMDESRTFREVAVIVGCSAGTVSRRIRSLKARLRNPLVIALFERACPVPEEYREIGLDYFLRGRNTREIAQLRELSRFQVMQLIYFIRTWFSGFCANRDAIFRRMRASVLHADT